MRDNIVHAIANFVLRFASEEYQVRLRAAYLMGIEYMNIINDMEDFSDETR